MAKILVVDDEPKVLQVTGQVLESADHDVTLLDSPEQALESLKKNPHQFDLIILDWKLRSAMDGDVVMKVLKSIHPDFKTPIIFVTAHTKISSKYLMRLGAYDTLEKPVSTQTLLDAVDRAIEIKPPDDPHRMATGELDEPDTKTQALIKKIVDAISSTNSLKEAAEKLGTSRASLYRWLEKTGLAQFYIDKE